MGNCISSSNKKKSFKDVQNSVLLTKQKTDKKSAEERLKLVNKNYIDDMKPQLAALGGGAGALGESKQLIISQIQSPEKEKCFPDFKRKEYDEGNMHKELVYFSLNQVNPNYTKTLGRDFVNLFSEKEGSNLSNLLRNLLKISLGDCQLSNQDYLSRKQETFTNIQKEILDKEKGYILAMEVLRKALEKEGITLLYQKHDKQLTASTTKKSWSQMQNEEVQNLRFLNLHLLAANLVTEYMVIEFKDSGKFSFGSLSAESELRDELIKEIKEEVINGVIRKIVPDNKKELTIIAVRIVHDIHEINITPILENNKKSAHSPVGILKNTQEHIENIEKVFKLCLVIPELDPEYLPKVVFSLDQALKTNYPLIYNSIERCKLIKTLHVTDDDWNAWGNREFRETIPLSNTYLVSQLGGRPYFKPSNGWKRYGFEVGCFDLNSDIWLKNKSVQHDENMPDGEWSNGYVNFLSSAMTKNSNFFNNVNPVYSIISEAEDIGMNKDKFKEKKCGRGVIFSQKVENFLCKGDKKPVLRTCPVEVEVDGDKKWFLVLLQVRVRPEGIRSPKNYDNVYFVVNEPEDIRPIGVMMKEINKEEVETYSTA